MNATAPCQRGEELGEEEEDVQQDGLLEVEAHLGSPIA